ncbi:hypothetical protein D3C78_1894280 [compost metagenome]
MSLPLPALITSLPPWPSITLTPALPVMLSLPWLPTMFSISLRLSRPVAALLAALAVTVAPAVVADRS